MSRMSAVMDAPRPTSSRSSRSRAGAVHRTGSTSLPRSDFSHDTPQNLLGKYWEFVKNPLSATAAILVSTHAMAEIVPLVNGALKELVEAAGGLQKAHGRNITAAVVGDDLDLHVPSGYTPTFDLYLQAIGIRPENAQERTFARDIKGAIRRKIKEVRKPPEPEPPPPH